MGFFGDPKILRFSFVVREKEVDNEYGRKLVRRITEKVFPSMVDFFDSRDFLNIVNVFGPKRGRSGFVFDVASPSFEVEYLILKAFRQSDESEVVFVGNYEKFPQQIEGEKVLRLRLKNAKLVHPILEEIALSGKDMMRFFGIVPSFKGLKRIKTLWFKRENETTDVLIEIECVGESCLPVEFLRFRGVGIDRHLGFGDVEITLHETTL